MNHCWVCGQDSRFVRMDVLDADRGTEPYSLVLCPGCGSGRIDVFPSDPVLSAHYDQSYYGGGESKFAAPLQALVNLSLRRRARLICEYLPGPGPLAVLDIGCGRGDLLRELGKTGVNGTGLERAPLDSRFESPSIEYRIGDLGEQGFPRHRFDAVVIWHVLEHLLDPQATLVEVGEILKPGGMLVIAVPNNSSWQARLFRNAWFHLDVPRHLHFFGHQGMELLLERQGYEVLASTTSDFAQNIFGFIQSALNRMAPRRSYRLYQLMRSAQSAPRLLELGLWLLPAVLLLPFALLENAVSVACNRGACSIVFARKI